MWDNKQLQSEESGKEEKPFTLGTKHNGAFWRQHAEGRHVSRGKTNVAELVWRVIQIETHSTHSLRRDTWLAEIVRKKWLIEAKYALTGSFLNIRNHFPQIGWDEMSWETKWNNEIFKMRFGWISTEWSFVIEAVLHGTSVVGWLLINGR